MQVQFGKADRAKHVADRLSEGRPLFGLIHMYPGTLLIEMADQAGMDFVILDAEHGFLSREEFHAALAALQATRLISMVRLADHDRRGFDGFLDAGADVVIVPHVETRQEALDFVQWKGAHPDASLILILESRLGVANAHEILGVPGVDGALVGAVDLSTDLGFAREFDRPAYATALHAIQTAARDCGKILGAVPHGPHSLEALVARGYRLNILNTDRTFVREAFAAVLDGARRASDPRDAR